ncbi:RHS repeat domain-containing protein, partial [Shewanella sp.]|uniref:RHS repeat domain-containing protein n=1 Tax=Shewanella sp. TaxID=50422 RepID=UPI003567F974
DVFGRPRDIASGNTLLSGTNWQGVTKGYTNHEHLIDQELIHMNGRIYDFNVGRFLSVDPFLQFPENSQSANPYSYILNNPMSGVDPTGSRSEELDEVISGKVFEKLEKDESGNLYVTADGETYKLTSVSNGEKNFSISFDGNGGGTAQVGKTTGTVSLHKGNSSTNVGGEQQKDKGVNGNIDKKTLKKLSRNTKNKMNSAIRLARKKMTSFCAASPSDCVDLSVDEFDSTPFEWSKNKDSLHPDDRISKRKHIGAIVERFGPDNKVKSVQLFAGGIVLQGKTTTSGLAEVLLHEYWHTSSPGTAAFKGGGDFETPAYKWSQAVMNHDTGE